MPVDLLRRRAFLAPVLAVGLVVGLAGCSRAAPVAQDGRAEPSASGRPSPVEASPEPSVGASAVSSPLVTGHPSSPAAGAGAGSRSTPAKETTPANDASRLRSLPAATKQVVIVQSASVSATTATLRAYARTGAGWQAALPEMRARVGGNGFSDSKREGDRTTPAGMFAIDATMYGIAPNPGVRYGYHQLVEGDWWNENGATPGYNTFQHGPSPGGPSEALWQVSPQYTHFAVIRYNMPATAGRGSGIFLHQANGNATLGCVSLPAGDLVTVLKWLDPAAQPRIVMAPTAWLGRY